MESDAASVWSLCDGDPLKISEWCSRRIELGLCQEPSEIKYIRQVMGSCHAIVDLEVRPVFQAMNRNANAQHQAFLRGEKARVEASDERRQLMAEREAQRRAATSYEVIRQRVAAAPKPAVDTLQRQRLERSLKATPAMTEPMTTTPATKSHSRRARGECGVKLGKKIDRVLAEIREHQAACESTCCALLPCWRNQSLPRWIHQLLQRGRCRNGRPWNLLALGAVLASLIKGPPGT